jgi:hypothetical protein
MILQAVLIAVLAFAAVILYGAGTFVHNQIHDQLSAQKISFPAQTEVKAGGALDPAKFSGITQYAGQQVDDGVKAQAYANDFIGEHLTTVAGGLTYAEVSAQAQASPTDTKLAGQKDTLFKGETLRGLLLNAYGWWTIATYSVLAAFGIAIAAALVLVAFLFELVEVLRDRRVAVKTQATARATA